MLRFLNRTRVLLKDLHRQQHRLQQLLRVYLTHRGPHAAGLLEIVHDFIVFDAGTKKACRHNQYFGVKAAQERIVKREGGIIWHTQGSGKSILMVLLAKWVLEHDPQHQRIAQAMRQMVDAPQRVGQCMDSADRRVGEGVAALERAAVETGKPMNAIIADIDRRFLRHHGHAKPHGHSENER